MTLWDREENENGLAPIAISQSRRGTLSLTTALELRKEIGELRSRQVGASNPLLKLTWGVS
jgi:hypothetical protein